jgi:trimeric autotransporter adhesin
MMTFRLYPGTQKTILFQYNQTLQKSINMKSIIFITLALALSLGAGAQPGEAVIPMEHQEDKSGNVPHLLDFQGRLHDSGGEPVNGEVFITFSLYDVGSGGTALWSELRAVQVTDGLFQVKLGEVAALDPGLFTGASRWLGVKVGSDAEMSPRTRISSVGYAMQAVEADPSWQGIPSPDGTIWRNGRVGLGVDDPGYQLHIQGSETINFYSQILEDAPSLSFAIIAAAPVEEGRGMVGFAGGTTEFNIGVGGQTESQAGAGVFGHANSIEGAGKGVFGQTFSFEGVGVYGIAQRTTGLNMGVQGISKSSTGDGVYGVAEATSGLAYGVHGTTFSPGGIGVSAHAVASSGETYGVRGQVQSPTGVGVQGTAAVNTSGGIGVRGTAFSPSGVGVEGLSTAGTGEVRGVRGTVHSDQGTGVYGLTLAEEGFTRGVMGVSQSTNGRGVEGWGFAEGGLAIGVAGGSNSPEGIGVIGVATASTGFTYGVLGEVVSGSGAAVMGENLGNGNTGYLGGVHGVIGNHSNGNYGHLGTSWDGVVGRSDVSGGYSIWGVQGENATFAGRFTGNVSVTGTLSKGGGSFEIDHPLDPENKILRHSFIESPDMMNVYNGNVETDAQGRAEVKLPDYFEALNDSFRYQLTVIGTFAQAIIGEEIRDNRFLILTDQPGVKVSWQVTGIRRDAWANENRIVVEEYKEEAQRGYYLHPQAFNQTDARSVMEVLRPGWRDAGPASGSNQSNPGSREERLEQLNSEMGARKAALVKELEALEARQEEMLRSEALHQEKLQQVLEKQQQQDRSVRMIVPEK